MTTLALSLVSAGSRCAQLLAGMAALALLSRSLDAPSLGEYFLFVAALAILTVLADCGLTQGAFVFSSREPEHVRDVHRVLISAALALGLGVSGVAVGAAWVFGGVRPEWSPPSWLYLFPLLLPMKVYGAFWNGMMIGLRRIVPLNGAQLLYSAASLVGVASLVTWQRGGFRAAIASYAVATLCQCTCMALLAQRYLRSAPTGPSAGGNVVWQTRRLLSFGARGYPHLVASLLSVRIPLFLLEIWHGGSAVGTFSVVQQVTERMLLPVGALQEVTVNRMATLPRLDALAALNRYLRSSLWAMVSLAALGIVLAPAMVAVFLGDAPAAATTALRILLLGVPFSTMAALMGPYFVGQLRRPGLMSSLAWLAALVVLGAGSLAIAPFGVVGAAAAVLAAQIVPAGVMAALYAPLSGAPTRLDFWPRPAEVVSAFAQFRDTAFPRRAPW